MFDYRLDFDSRWFLVLLGMLPVIWLLSYRSLAGLGPVRRLVALGLRSLMLVLLIFALAEVQIVRTTDKLTVIYLVDQSQSIPEEERRAAIEYVNSAILEHRSGGDRAGVIVFGREAAMEVPPYDDDVQIPTPVESIFDPNQTNLAGAIKLAQASFPHDAAKRIVVISDGNENIGDALEQAEAARDSGIGFDVVPIVYPAAPEVAVEKVVVPPNVRKGQPFDLKVVINNATPADDEDDGVVRGKLVVSMRSDDQPIVLSEQTVDLPPGKQVFTLRQTLDKPNFYTYEARFEPEDRSRDRTPQNNRATSFAQVRGSGQILLVEGVESRGQHTAFVDALRRENLEVTVRDSTNSFTDLNQLQQYDTVVLANVPREEMTDEQVKMLTINTQEMGGGLVMVGGPQSFGAGGWTNTPIEEAMPVDFEIKSAKVIPKGALALMMHASEMPQGNHWQKVIARRAVEALGTEDYCGLLHYGVQGDAWLWGGMIRVGAQRNNMLRRIDQMMPGDMPDFDPSMKKAEAAFAQLRDAAAKHMIIISDGDPAPPSAGVIAALMRLQVSISTVAVGTHGPAGSNLLRDIARRTGGNYYAVTNGNALPKIFQKEARRVARPLVYEDPKGFEPLVHMPTEIIAGVEDLPPITGFVRTTAKSNPLVEVGLVSSQPSDSNDPILAGWTYGIGRTVALTTDVGSRWAVDWPEWESYDKLASTMIRWTMRPSGDEGKYTIATDVEDGKVKVFVTALDKDDEFLNFLDLKGGVIDPSMESSGLKLEQTAPGRYVGSFDVKDPGSYLLTLSAGAGKPPIRAGVNVPYSAEFSDRETDMAKLATLAALTPRGGAPGMLIQTSSPDAGFEDLLAINTFRHDLPKATSRQEAWYLALFLAGLLFFFDVFFRRVTVNLAWVGPMTIRLRDKILRRDAPAPATETMARLRTRKLEISERLEQQRSAARFEPDPQQPAPSKSLEETIASAGATDRPQQAAKKAEGLGPSQPQEEDFTARLLKAKKKVWDEREKPNRGS